MALETPYIAFIPLQSTVLNNEVTKDDVKRNHQLFMDSGKFMDANKLIDILGGTNAILQHYLSSDNLSQDQLNKINAIICRHDIEQDIIPTLGKNSFTRVHFDHF